MIIQLYGVFDAVSEWASSFLMAHYHVRLFNALQSYARFDKSEDLMRNWPVFMLIAPWV